MTSLRAIGFAVLLALALPMRGAGATEAATRPPEEPPPPRVIPLEQLGEGLGYGELLHKGERYEVAVVDLDKAQLDLFWKKPDGTPFASFGALEAWLAAAKRPLLFATNAGIYSSNHVPGGLHIERGEELRPLNLREGGGNFHLMPNGVFFVDDAGAHILDSQAYQATAAKPRLAAQSGPLLVRGRALHPKFRAESNNRYLRSGVGLPGPGLVFEGAAIGKRRVCFLLSRRPVNFYAFASAFRDGLACEEALYLDGHISAFHIPGKRSAPALDLYVGLFGVSAKE